MKLWMPLTLATTSLVAACSTNPDRQPVPSFSKALIEVTKQDGRACLRTSDIKGYGVNTPKVISIDGGRQYYLATTMFSCSNLETSVRAFFKGTMGSVCGNSQTKVISGREPCYIQHVFEFDSRTEAFEALEKAKQNRTEIIEKNKDK